MELILASASPRRRELIELLGVPFRIVPSLYVEPAPPLEPVNLPELVMEFAARKALEVAQRFEKGWVLGADTLVSLADPFGVPLGKPTDPDDACRMLTMLAGRAHYVFTGIALIPPALTGDTVAPVRTFTKTLVKFRDLTPGMIDKYVATGEPMDKAGAYGAQGFAAPFIERIEGDFYNVVGLPLCEVGRILDSAGIQWAMPSSNG